MKTLKAFLLFIRWPNLVFIIITQVLYYFVLLPALVPLSGESLVQFPIFLLVSSSVVIAAAGYIINDYFDIQIDKINKPAKVIVDRLIKRRWAIFWHLFLSGLGMFLSLYLSFRMHSYWLFLGNSICILLLWVYSIVLKRKLLSGNIVIALLTAWVVLSTYLLALGLHLTAIQNSGAAVKLLQLTLIYAGFAFIVTIIREVIKDMEDAEGDRRYASTTMPIIWGFATSKVYTAVWIIVTIGILACIGIYCMQQHQYILFGYIITVLIFPASLLLYRLRRAKTQPDFHALSNVVKFIMLFGILSILFFIHTN